MGPTLKRNGIALWPADYWELQARAARVSELEAERLTWLADHARRLRHAQAERAQTLTRIADKYGLDPAKDYAADDATCTLRKV